MSDLIEFVCEFLCDFAIESIIVPKIIKYILVILTCGFVVWAGINMGDVLGFVLVAMGLLIGIYMIAKIYRS